MIEHDVILVAGGVEYTKCWTSFEVEQDIRKWPGSFRFTASPATSDITRALTEAVRNAEIVSVRVDGTTVSTGRIVDIEQGVSREQGTYVNVSGAGPLGPATKSCMPLGHSCRGMTVKDAVAYALSPWGVEVIADNAANRAACVMRTQRTRQTGDNTLHTENVAGGAGGHINFQQASPDAQRTAQVPDDRAVVARPGETVADWIKRFLAQVGMLCWETARGQVFIGLPDYTMPPLYTIVVPEVPDNATPVEGQVISSKLVERPGDQATCVTVTGRVGRAGATRVWARATDDILTDTGWISAKIVTDDKLRDQVKAQTKANQILRAEQLESYVYECTIAGHGVR